jgi:hypothetical protein
MYFHVEVIATIGDIGKRSEALLASDFLTFSSARSYCQSFTVLQGTRSSSS